MGGRPLFRPAPFSAPGNIPGGTAGAPGASLQLKRAGIEPVVHAALCDQAVVAAPLHDPAMIHDQDDVGIFHGGEAVRDDEHRPALHQLIHAVLHERLGARIDGRSRLIQDHDRRIGHGGAGDRQQLPLPLREPAAVAPQDRLIPLRQHPDKAVGVGEPGGGDARLVARIEVAVAQIFHHGTGEQVHILQHHAQRPAQIRLFDLVDVDAIVSDLPVRNVIKPVEQVGDGCLAGAGRADKGDLLPRLSIQRDVVQHGLVGLVGKVHPVEYDAALEAGIGGCAVVVRMFPRPHAGAPVRLAQFAVRIRNVDEGHIAVVRLRRFVHEREDARGAGQRRYDGVELVGDLRHRVGKAAREGQERSDHAERQRTAAHQAEVGHARKRHICAQDGDDHVLRIAQRVHHRHHGVGPPVGVRRSGRPRPVPLAQRRLRLLFVAEHLDHLLPVHHFLHIAVELGQRPLLFHEIGPNPAGDGPHDPQDEADRDDGHQRQIDAHIQHPEKHGGDRKHRGDQLRHRLCDQLPQGVGIVGVQAHDIAVRAGVERTDRKALHPLKHIVPDGLERPLRDGDHQPVVQQGRRHAGQIYDRHARKRPQQPREHGVRRDEQRRNMVVDQNLQKQRARRPRHRADQDAHDHQQQAPAVRLHIGEQAGDGLAIIGRAAGRRVTPRFPHLRFPLSAAIHRPPDRWRRSGAAPRAALPPRFARRP